MSLSCKHFAAFVSAISPFSIHDQSSGGEGVFIETADTASHSLEGFKSNDEWTEEDIFVFRFRDKMSWMNEVKQGMEGDNDLGVAIYRITR
jgi:hypothetical protein